jgi:orotate phosphoribosyltransferase
VTRTLAELTSLFPARRGHFRFESGHHGEVWLDLELLCLDPSKVELFASELARRLEPHKPQMVVGPLVEGAFVAIRAAALLGCEFAYAVRIENRGKETGSMYPVDYRIPDLLRPKVSGRRIAIVNDVVNAGSAVLGTYRDLQECDAEVVALGTLLALGDWGSSWTVQAGVALETIATWPNALWKPAECPLCAAGVPLTS